jgi:hypothetical protein
MFSYKAVLRRCQVAQAVLNVRAGVTQDAQAGPDHTRVFEKHILRY